MIKKLQKKRVRQLLRLSNKTWVQLIANAKDDDEDDGDDDDEEEEENEKSFVEVTKSNDEKIAATPEKKQTPPVDSTTTSSDDQKVAAANTADAGGNDQQEVIEQAVTTSPAAAASLIEKKELFEKEKQEFLDQIPNSVKERYGQMYFGKWSAKYLPVLVMDPYKLEPGPGSTREQYIAMFEKVSSIFYWQHKKKHFFCFDCNFFLN